MKLGPESEFNPDFLEDGFKIFNTNGDGAFLSLLKEKLDNEHVDYYDDDNAGQKKEKWYKKLLCDPIELLAYQTNYIDSNVCTAAVLVGEKIYFSSNTVGNGEVKDRTSPLFENFNNPIQLFECLSVKESLDKDVGDIFKFSIPQSIITFLLDDYRPVWLGRQFPDPNFTCSDIVFKRFAEMVHNYSLLININFRDKDEKRLYYEKVSPALLYLESFERPSKNELSNNDKKLLDLMTKWVYWFSLTVSFYSFDKEKDDSKLKVGCDKVQEFVPLLSGIKLDIDKDLFDILKKNKNVWRIPNSIRSQIQIDNSFDMPNYALLCYVRERMIREYAEKIKKLYDGGNVTMKNEKGNETKEVFEFLQGKEMIYLKELDPPVSPQLHCEVKLFLYLKHQLMLKPEELQRLQFGISKPLCLDCSKFFFLGVEDDSRPNLRAACNHSFIDSYFHQKEAGCKER